MGFDSDKSDADGLKNDNTDSFSSDSYPESQIRRKYEELRPEHTSEYSSGGPTKRAPRSEVKTENNGDDKNHSSSLVTDGFIKTSSSDEEKPQKGKVHSKSSKRQRCAVAQEGSIPVSDLRIEYDEAKLNLVQVIIDNRFTAETASG